MVDIRRETYERNGKEAILDSDVTLRLNEKHIAEGLDHKNLQVATLKYVSNHRKHRYELADKPKKNQQNFYRRKITNKLL